MEGECYEGTVKAFKGSFGFIACQVVAERHKGRDTFLHRNAINSIPAVGAGVAFKLALDEKGNPKAVEATITSEPPADGAGDAAAGGAAKSRRQRGAPEAAEAGAAPKPNRAALMLFRGDEVLVLREFKEGHLRWSDIGGKVEPGEALLETALRELQEEGQGFLAEEAFALLAKGLRHQFGGDGAGEQATMVTLSKTGKRPQVMAVFPMDCTGVELKLLSREEPNVHGVHELRWLSRSHPELSDRQLTRWPLLCALRTLAPAGRAAPGGGRDRSRSRSPRGS